METNIYNWGRDDSSEPVDRYENDKRYKKEYAEQKGNMKMFALNCLNLISNNMN